MKMLHADEVELIGQWHSDAGKISADDTCHRIGHLIQERLIRIATDSTGWRTLYRDPQDSRLWELNYPQNEIHGGGPPRLTCVSSEYAEAIYAVKA
jgi:hypothetical protein